MFPGSNFEPKLFEKLKNKFKKNIFYFLVLNLQE